MADRIEDLIKAWSPTIRKAFETAIHDIRDRTRIAELARLIEAGDIDGALKAVGLEAASFRPLDSSLRQAFEASGLDVSAAIDVSRRANVVRALFDVRDPRAAGWIEQHSVSVIRDIVIGQQEVARLSINAGLIVGRPPQAVALDLVGRISKVTGRREGGALGLTPSQETWAQNYAAEVGGKIADPAALTRKLRDKRFDAAVRHSIRDGKPIPAETQRAMTAAYRNRSLKFRATAIAENEAHLITQEGQIEAWRQAVRRGVVQYDAVRRFWVTMEDPRVRPTHAAVPGLNRMGVGLDQPFATPKGPALHPGWDFEAGCRCRERIKVVALPMELSTAA